VTNLNSCSVSSSETYARNGIKSWKAHLLLLAERHKAIDGLQFSNEWRTATLHDHMISFITLFGLTLIRFSAAMIEIFRKRKSKPI
jgi:hypothetical protein